jgi:hypothetical protein
VKTFILTSLFWLAVLGGVLAVRSTHNQTQWVDFQSDAVFSLNDFMGRLAKQEDVAKRTAMANEMGSALKEAHDLRELKAAIVRVANKYYP